MSAVVAPVTFRENVFEHSLSYTREDGKRVEMALTHIPDTTPFASIATFNKDADEPESLSELTLEEARYLFAFLGKLEGLNLLQ